MALSSSTQKPARVDPLSPSPPPTGGGTPESLWGRPGRSTFSLGAAARDLGNGGLTTCPKEGKTDIAPKGKKKHPSS